MTLSPSLVAALREQFEAEWSRVQSDPDELDYCVSNAARYNWTPRQMYYDQFMEHLSEAVYDLFSKEAP